MALKVVEQRFCDGGDTIYYGIVPWDSEIFGFTIVEVSRIDIGDMEGFGRLVSSFEVSVRRTGCKMICVKVPAGEREVLRGLQKCGYVFVEESVKPYIGDLQTATASFADLFKDPLSPATDGTIEEIRSMAYRTFIHDRFHLDSGFSKEKASARYAYWVDSSYRSGDDVLFLEEGGAVAGFSIVVRSGDKARLALIGVDEGRKGRGLGRGLLAGTCQYVRDKGMRELSSGVSLNNIPALNLYAKCGFRFRDPVYALHKWM